MAIKIENVEVFGWETAIRGLRNPFNSWCKSDSYNTHVEDAETLETAPYAFFVGEADLKLMRKLANAGSDHGKFLRMINVTFDCVAPLYWWKEFDTYKVGTVANSCSTMNKIAEKEFTLDDFSHEHLCIDSEDVLKQIIKHLNNAREAYNYSKDKLMWWQMIQLLPSSYNQRRTVQLNYQVLRNMHHARKNHKLDCWIHFCKWVETLPYANELIEGTDAENDAE